MRGSFWKDIREQTHQQLARTTLAQAAQYQISMDFKATPIKDLLNELPLAARIYGGKPTGRFLRNFGISKTNEVT